MVFVGAGFGPVAFIMMLIQFFWLSGIFHNKVTALVGERLFVLGPSFVRLPLLVSLCLSRSLEDS